MGPEPRIEKDNTDGSVRESAISTYERVANSGVAVSDFESPTRVDVKAVDILEIASQTELERIASELVKLAKADPEEALRIARSGRSRLVRAKLINSAFEGWAQADPETAIFAALSEPGEFGSEALEAAFQGAAAYPEDLLRIAEQAQQRGAFADLRRSDVDGMLANALLKRGKFEEALAFSLQKSDSATPHNLLGQCFESWARWEPEEAVLAAVELEDPLVSEKAYDAAISSWAQSDPGSLAEFANALPEGKTRGAAFAKSLPRWVSSDADAAADWLNDQVPSPELDVGFLALVNHPYLAERRPSVAIEWAESLADNGLRSNAVVRVVKQWAATDRQAAIDYVKRTASLSPMEQRELLSLFGEPFVYTAEGDLAN